MDPACARPARIVVAYTHTHTSMSAYEYARILYVCACVRVRAYGIIVCSMHVFITSEMVEARGARDLLSVCTSASTPSVHSIHAREKREYTRQNH